MGDEPSKADISEFERSGYIPWITELAGIPRKRCEQCLCGTWEHICHYRSQCPNYCAGILGTLIKGLERIMFSGVQIR